MPPDAVAEIEALYRTHGPTLLLFASAMTCERGRAQDAVHQVFLRLIESGNRLEVRDTRAYLLTCVRNAILNDVKARLRHVELADEPAWFAPPDRDFSAERNLRFALAALPDDQRQVVVLHLWGELTFLEIAEVLSISANTAASRYRYALSKLRESMGVQEKSCAKS